MKLMLHYLIIVLFSCSSLCVSAQTDTIRIMQYNLLNYGNGANVYSYKDPRLDTILHYVQPDILGCNEIANDSNHSIHILNTILGGGWSKGSFINTGNEVQTNMLFWKTSKFGLKSEQSICSNLRDIIAYKLFYKDTISVPHDTVYLTVMVAHLKASQGTQEEAERAAETQKVVDYMDSLAVSGNYILMGDLNLYTSNEQAYQNFINSSSYYSKLYDPINTPGDWNADASFANIHTQSTRTAQLPDGGANGGLDDRFDHQVVSGSITGDSSGIRYIPNTYKALGQDGLHFNDSLTALPLNTSAPWGVIQALYEMSDHLPVIADYKIHAEMPVRISTTGSITYKTRVVNPVVSGKLSIEFDKELCNETVNITLINPLGQTVFSSRKLVTDDLFLNLNINHLSTGLYFLSVNNGKDYTYCSKLVID